MANYEVKVDRKYADRICRSKAINADIYGEVGVVIENEREIPLLILSWKDEDGHIRKGYLVPYRGKIF